MTTATRLQLGVSRLEVLPDSVLKVFLDKSWIHLGAGSAPKVIPRSMRSRISGMVRGKRTVPAGDLYSRTNFQEFAYAKGDALPFPDGRFTFIFSEHFFEHLFLDEAMALFGECRRVLVPQGVMRVSVPDAELRTYEAPEPLGFPDPRMPFTDPDKHKTRWSIYSLSEALQRCGFEVVPLRFCDREGIYHSNMPSKNAAPYIHCAEDDLVFRDDYLRRARSLIVDAIKTASL